MKKERLIGQERKETYLTRILLYGIICIVGWSFGIAGSLLVISNIKIIITDMFALMVLVCVGIPTLLLAGAWGCLSSFSTHRLTIYEDGFVPAQTPLRNYLRRKKSVFISWEDVVNIRIIKREPTLFYRAFGAEGDVVWIALVDLKNGAGLGFGSNIFKGGGAEVLHKLEEISEGLKKKKIPYKKPGIYW